MPAWSVDSGEVDPGSVSDGLKAIFSYGKGTKAIKDRLNANTVTVMSGTIGGTYVQFGADLASVLDEGDNLRLLPVVGRGSVQRRSGWGRQRGWKQIGAVGQSQRKRPRQRDSRHQPQPARPRVSRHAAAR